jgi:hypothetical protein
VRYEALRYHSEDMLPLRHIVLAASHRHRYTSIALNCVYMVEFFQWARCTSHLTHLHLLQLLLQRRLLLGQRSQLLRRLRRNAGVHAPT